MMFCAQTGRLALLLLLMLFLTQRVSSADVLIGVSGERFVGKILEETDQSVVFQSESAGRITIPRTGIKELQRTPATLPANTNRVALATNRSAAIASSAWQPPGIGKDGFDWIQLKSDEWLKGHLDYVQNKKVQFESDKLEDLTLKLKDVRQIHSARPMYAKFEGHEQVYGNVVVSNEVVEVIGPEQATLPREQLTGITPGGNREIEFWSGKVSVGLNIQEGNTKQATVNASAELARRTPATQFLLDYLGNFGAVNGEQNANNHRINVSYDIRLSGEWFVRPVQLEYYRDQLANIAHRATAAIGVGYYLFDRDGLEWKFAAGPGYQYSKFETVTAGEPDSVSTPAGSFQMYFKADVTSRLTFIESYTATLTSQEAGLYTHHLVSTLEFEIKHYLNLDLSFVWDYLQNPQTEANGSVPVHSDLRLTLGIGAKF